MTSNSVATFQALCLFFLVLIMSVQGLEFGQEWETWKGQHSKLYGSIEEEQRRYSIWLSNKEYIDSHNGTEEGYWLRMNHFGDLTLEEFNTIYTCHYVNEMSSNVTAEGSQYKPPDNAELPTSFDWRNQNAVTAVKAQGEYRCHSCYAFAAVAALESHHAISTGNKIKLSEQNVIDCSRSYGNLGCTGGNYKFAYKYIIENGGIDTQYSYPYKASKNNCRYNSEKVGATMKSVSYIESGSEYALQCAVVLKGPVVVAINHNHRSFQFYSGGIYRYSYCYSSYYRLTHEMVVIGYNTYNSIDYWFLKNSYGSSWGIRGYMKLFRGTNMCGIATDAGFPIV